MTSNVFLGALCRLCLSDDMLRCIGAEIAKMHLAEIVHGDLTTSNMMVRLTPSHSSTTTTPFEIVSVSLYLSLSLSPVVDRSTFQKAKSIYNRPGFNRFRIIFIFLDGRR